MNSTYQERKYKFMEIDIDLLENGKLSMFMKYYKEESIALFGKDLDTTVSSPTKKGLQKINESSPRIDK